jgi:FMN phosphatase YigB (HAD superfamily)
MRQLNVFFDVDHTLVMWDGRLRPHAHEVFQAIREAGHTIYVWSGVGIRHYDMKKHGLDEYVERYFVKPLHDYRERLPLYKVDVMPDFVIDDYPQVVEAFEAGYHISDILKPDDRELLEVLRLIEETAHRPAAAAEAGEAGEAADASVAAGHSHDADEGIEVLTEGLSDLDETVEPEGVDR